MKRTVKFNRGDIKKLPDGKPVVYGVQTSGGKDNYVGVAKRGRVQERVQEHLPSGKDYIPGSNVQIEQMQSIRQAEQKEKRIIARGQPKYNDQHK